MKSKGFTFLELIITLVLLAILSTLTVVSYSYFLQKNEQQTIIDELQITIQYAKMQALILGEPVVLTPIDNSSNWALGMLLTKRKRHSQEMEVIHHWQWNRRRWSLTWDGVHSSDKIIFSDSVTTAMSNGRFTLSNPDTQQKLVITLNRLGRIRVGDNL